MSAASAAMAASESALAEANRRKAAIVVLALGEENARPLIRRLEEEEVHRLTLELTSVYEVSAEETQAALEEFHGLLTAQQFVTRGGLEFAERLLTESFGRQRAEDYLREVKRLQEESSGNLSRLRKVDPRQLAKFLEGEHPQTVALVLAHLDPRAASQTLLAIPEPVRVPAVRRLAEMQQFSPEMAQKVGLVLNRRLESLGDEKREAWSGFKAVADVMNRMDGQSAQTILEAIEKDEPKTAIAIRNLMFTFEDLLTVPAASMREIVGTIDKKLLATAMRNAPENIRAHFFSALSSRAVEMLREDMEAMGPVRSKDVHAAQGEILLTARRLESEGKVTLKPEVEDEYVV